MRVFMAFKTESILPIQPGEKNKEKAHFDVHTFCFLVLKNATMMAEIITSEVVLCGFEMLSESIG